MVKLEGCFREVGLEVEYRTGKNLLPVILERFGGKGAMPPQKTHRVDSYFFIHPETGGDCKRIRSVERYDSNGRPRKVYYQSSKVYTNGNGDGGHAFEAQTEITEAEYKRLARSRFQVVVEGDRSDLWIVESRVTYSKPQKPGELHICIDKIHRLGDFTEFELEIPGYDSMKPRQRNRERREAERVIFEFADQLGVPRGELIMKTYPELLLEKAPKPK